jgi:hypothetical protein
MATNTETFTVSAPIGTSRVLDDASKAEKMKRSTFVMRLVQPAIDAWIEKNRRARKAGPKLKGN